MKEKIELYAGYIYEHCDNNLTKEDGINIIHYISEICVSCFAEFESQINIIINKLQEKIETLESNRKIETIKEYRKDFKEESPEYNSTIIIYYTEDTSFGIKECVMLATYLRDGEAEGFISTDFIHHTVLVNTYSSNIKGWQYALPLKPEGI